jgi:hypothetical protein
MNKIISLTFDYELFLNNSGTPENCILKPVARLIELFDKLGIKATFFIDSLYYQRLIENGNFKDTAKLIKTQIQTLVSKGHRIELHLHPIWLDAEYDNGAWLFPDYRYYRLDSFDETRINEIFTSQVKLLSEIAGEVDENYSLFAFRAGGLCIEPFGILQKIFEKTGLKVDSSVAFNTFHHDGIHNYDFRNYPDLEYYKFSDKTGEIDQSGKFYEFPISTYEINFFDKINKKFTGKLYKNKFKIFGDGKGINIPLKRTISDKLSDSASMFSLEGIHPDFLLSKIKKTTKKIVTFISHPKLLSESSFECIEKMHQNGYDFFNLNEIYELIEAGKLQKTP